MTSYAYDHDLAAPFGSLTLHDALTWAAEAEPGSRLVDYDETGLSDLEDSGSRCGFDDRELAAIRNALPEGIVLVADDVGLVARRYDHPDARP